MDIFRSIGEIELQDRYLQTAEKELELLERSTESLNLGKVQKTIEPVFTDRIADLKQKLNDEVVLIAELVEAVEDQSILPEKINVGQIVGEQMETMPEWFSAAIQKQFEKNRAGLNISIKKMFKSMFSGNERATMKKDLLNCELIIKRMTQFDKNKLCNSQMMELLAMISRFEQARIRHVRFLNDAAKRVVEFVKQNQQKAVNFSNSNKTYVEEIRSPEEWRGYSFQELRQNVTAPVNFYQPARTYERFPLASTGFLRNPTESSFANKMPTSMEYFRAQKLGRGVSPMIGDMDVRGQIQRGREQYYERQSIKDTGRNFYYRQASSVSQPSPISRLEPQYPLNNLYREFYY